MWYLPAPPGLIHSYRPVFFLPALEAGVLGLLLPPEDLICGLEAPVKREARESQGDSITGF